MDCRVGQSPVFDSATLLAMTRELTLRLPLAKARP